ncbi:antiviral reverse transcriptase Drt3b [Xanthomonas sp. 3307]|uniref:antiviral reverse transcriptase Drt3b n=1 Tax=Xanthomonas sp. 3307 TaxID=3035316 RepID=UPI00161F55D6|nr:antiviral reverse transcriptase Drt3b [Xanthomonas sp. 3307]MBB5941912.1 hypothetical protein [Xanthomonas sp. 3307]
MSSKKKIDIKARERSLLTDTLPYEVPIFFTNANFAAFAMQERKKPGSHKLHAAFLLYGKSTKPTKPLNFEISRATQAPRRLSVPHPISQHRISLLYSKYEFFITNACARSQASLRYPSRVATHYIDSRYAQPVQSTSTAVVDEDPAGFRNQSKWASTYFSYRDYSLSHRFFESEEFLELERKYSFLMKLDVARCFESIYTHSIEWGMRGKDFAKTHLSRKHSTFEADFDAAVRHGNWNETHGILVGPEYSRVFAEIILQSADREIAISLDGRSPSVLVKRYVDDYYVFSNSKDVLDVVEDLIRRALLDLNLHLNSAKKEVLDRPFVSKISVARGSVANSVDSFFDRTKAVLDVDIEVNTLTPQVIEFAKNEFVSSVRKLSVQLGTTYGNAASFALAVLKRKLEEIIFKIRHNEMKFVGGSVTRLAWLIAIMRASQFLYSTDHRATTSVKLASIYSLLVDLASSFGCARGPLERQIIDGLRDEAMGSSSNDADEVTRINHICCVDLLLTEGRRLELSDIERYLGPASSASDLEKFSIFQLSALMFLCRRRRRFSLILSFCQQELLRRIYSKFFQPMADASHALLLSEFISCPYLDDNVKVDVVRHGHKAVLGADCSEEIAREILSQSSWISFTDWSSQASLAEMLKRKELTPAYE